MRSPISFSVSSSVKVKSSRGFRPRQSVGRKRHGGVIIKTRGSSRKEVLLLHLLPLLHLETWFRDILTVCGFCKVSGLNCFFLLNLCLYSYRSCSWNRKKKIHGWRRKMCTPHGPHIPVSRGFLRIIGKWGGSFDEVYFIEWPHHTWSWDENSFRSPFSIINNNKFKNTQKEKGKT